ncbi:NAD(P)H-dependent oxidoreductase [Gordonia polyisoprenivorans]|uniref:NAD(P)H-dependent oxidoreductase n=1 Tax=Gordonia polyisoprenivorans TaxID=84595 RepID=UPI001EE67B05|nr:NAD(P)H-dependent oxidoreductase [Gordonia polyisoprenivorans]
MSVLDDTALGADDEVMDDGNSRRTVLWLSAHPSSGSLNAALRRSGVERLHQLGNHVIESDLYSMGWDPVVRARDGGRAEQVPTDQFRVSRDTRRAFLSDTQPIEVQVEQQKVCDADALIIQFPLWWYGVPAILKGWFDRVFISGFAFGINPETGRKMRFEQGPFVGKRAFVVTTLGDRESAIGPRGKSGELTQMLFGLLHGTLAYTGMSVLTPWALASSDFVKDIVPVQQSLWNRLDNLFTDDPIQYRPQFTGQYTDLWELKEHIRPGESGLDIHRG